MLYRILNRLVGVEIDSSLRPLLLVSFLSTVAFSALWSFIGIWASSDLHASPIIIGIMYAMDATAAATTGYQGGRWSDRVGRRQAIGLAWGAQSIASLALSVCGHDLIFGIVMVVIAGAASGPGFAATNAMVGDLVPKHNSETAYGTLRVVTNIGYMAGPPLGGLALVGNHWFIFFLGIALMGLISATAAFALLRNDRVVENGVPSEHQINLRTLFNDRPFLLILLSTFAGFLVYTAYEVMLPIAAVMSYRLSATTWGLLAMINPILIVAFQGRFIKATRRISMMLKLGGSLVLMGTPFLILITISSRWGIALVLILFAFGEMIWGPTSQAFAASLASEANRGAYLGTFGASGSAAWAVGPLVDLYLRGIGGMAATWAFTALMGAAAGLIGMAAFRLAGRHGRCRTHSIAPNG
ncbi:MAG: MFS transporter [Sulfobacillus sp.]